jgi:hypothetical protein
VCVSFLLLFFLHLLLLFFFLQSKTHPPAKKKKIVGAKKPEYDASDPDYAVWLPPQSKSITNTMITSYISMKGFWKCTPFFVASFVILVTCINRNRRQLNNFFMLFISVS